MNRVAECLARIDELNPALNAFITVVRDARGSVPVAIVGKWGADETVLRLAHAFQMSRPPSDVGFGGLRP